MSDLLTRPGMDIKKRLQDLSLQDRLLKNLLAILGFDFLVEDLLRMNNHQRALLAESMAPRHPEIDPPTFRVSRKNFLEGLNHLMTSGSMTARPRTNGNTRLMGISLLDDLVSILFQCLRGVNSFHSKPPSYPIDLAGIS
jgi:hypothetical protein